jgi:hypothetical protein
MAGLALMLLTLAFYMLFVYRELGDDSDQPTKSNRLRVQVLRARAWLTRNVA